MKQKHFLLTMFGTYVLALVVKIVEIVGETNSAVCAAFSVYLSLFPLTSFLLAVNYGGTGQTYWFGYSPRAMLKILVYTTAFMQCVCLVPLAAASQWPGFYQRPRLVAACETLSFVLVTVLAPLVFRTKRPPVRLYGEVPALASSDV